MSVDVITRTPHLQHQLVNGLFAQIDCAFDLIEPAPKPGRPVLGIVLDGTKPHTVIAAVRNTPRAGWPLTADRVQTVTPLTDLQLSFGLDEKALTIGGGQIQAAGGRISVEPLSLPLTSGEGWGGVVVVEGVQLNELLKSANLQDKAEFDAVVSGRLPFTYDPKDGWRIVGGVLNGVRPGRLSIQPQVFDDLAENSRRQLRTLDAVHDYARTRAFRSDSEVHDQDSSQSPVRPE